MSDHCTFEEEPMPLLVDDEDEPNLPDDVRVLTPDEAKVYRARNFCFTLNNYTGEEIAILREWDVVRYASIGREIGKKTGTPHLQGYLEFNSPVKASTLYAKIGKCYCRARYKPALAAARYTKKDKDFEEWGILSEQGKRSDLAGPVEDIVAGKSMREVAKKYPEQYVKFHKGFRALKCELIEPRNELPTVTVLWGSTGCGKSREARKMTNNPYVWGPEQDHWFCGYEGQKDVIFEEFRGQLQFGRLLRLLDRYDCKVQYKGGMCEFAATNIVITSPVHPDNWYFMDGNDGKIAQLFRRITKIQCLG